MKPLWLLTLALVPLGMLRAQTESEKTAPFAPLDYFDANCTRCHGPYGSFYGAEFGKNLKDDAALRHIVKEMAEGPGNAPLNHKDLETLTDFHRALRDGKPYLVLVATEKNEVGITLRGEATPESKVTLEDGTQIVEVTLEGHKWDVSVPTGFEVGKAKLRAVKDGKESLVDLITKQASSTED